MNEPITGERVSDILAKAQAAGFAVSERQLKRWHYKGLIPRPEQFWTEGKSGSEVIYAAGTSDQLIALCVIRRKVRRLKDVGWYLWWSGFPVAEKYWKAALKKRAASYGKNVTKIIAAIQSCIDDDGLGHNSGFLSRMRTMRLRNILFRQLRKRLGPDKFDNFLFLMVEILQGHFEGWPDGTADDADLASQKMTIDRALGLFRIRNEKDLTATPHNQDDSVNRKRRIEKAKLYDDVKKSLALLSDRLRGARLTDVLDACSDEEIASARNEIRGAFAFALVVAAFDSNARKYGLGLTVFAKFANYLELKTHQMMLVCLLALKKDSSFKENLDRFIESFRAAVLTATSLDQIESLRRTDPALADLLCPQIGTELSIKSGN